MVEGILALIVGLMLISNSGRISRLYRNHPRLTRILAFGSAAHLRFWSRDDVIRIAKVFWIFCGSLWLASGLILILKLAPAIRLP